MPVVPKKRVKLVAKKAGGPGASRKRAALPAGRPKKRAKQGGIVASYSKKELKASRALSLDNFIKAKLLIGQNGRRASVALFRLQYDRQTHWYLARRNESRVQGLGIDSKG